MSSSFPVKIARFLYAAILLTGNVLSAFPVVFQEVDTIPVKTVDTIPVKTSDTIPIKTIDTIPGKTEDTITVRTVSHAEELIRAERLFHGLAYPPERSVNCVECHNTRQLDTLNWNPDAVEISRSYLDKSTADLTRVLLKPAGKKMAEVHKGFQLTTEDIVLIKAYMDRLAGTGLKERKPVITNLVLLIIAFILFLITTADLILRKIFKSRKLNALILIASTITITWILVVNAIGFGRSRGYSPDQPVKFSHKVHSGQNQTDCNYCHYSARSSKTAGIPPGNVCMNCHLLVRTGTRSGVTEINKVISAYDSGKPVEWIRIYRLPDFVFFSHAQHVTAGGLTCEACHGDVKSMDRLYQETDLSMGWCIKCHDTRKVNLNNEYYKTYFSRFYNDLQAGRIDSVMAGVTGGRDCGNCHY